MVAELTERASFTQTGYYKTDKVISNTDVDPTTGLATASVPETSLIAIFLNTQACDNRNFELMK